MAKENNIILEEGMKRFQQILEYTTLDNMLVDEDGEQQGGDEMNSDMTPIDGNINGDNTPVGPDQNGNNGNMAPMGDNSGMMPQDGGQMIQTPQGFNPQDNFTNDNMGDESMMQPDDEVVDITELTDKQEETDNNVLKIDAKFDKLMKAIGHFEEIMRNQDEEISNLRQEFEKRNPTQLEKLSMQTAKSYPFNVTPEEYWKEKEATSNYRTEDDNNGVGQEQYTITKADLAGSSDWKSIADSFKDDDFMYNQTLNNILGRN